MIEWFRVRAAMIEIASPASDWMIDNADEDVDNLVHAV